MVAPKAWASLIARGPAAPWRSGRNALMPTMIIVPPMLATKTPSRVSASGEKPV